MNETNKEEKVDMRLKANRQPSLQDLKIEKLTLLVEELTKKVDGLIEKKLERNEGIIQPGTVTNLTAQTSNVYPVPTDYAQAVKEKLNSHFGIEIVPISDSPAFNFTIIVPDKYSTITPEYKQTYGRDTRPRVITYTDGLIGVKDWVERVWNSFNPTIQALIVADRN